MRLLGDRAVAHRPGHEPPRDRLDPLDLVDRHRVELSGAQAQQTADRHQPFVLLIDLVGVAAELLELPGAGGVLEAEDRLRREQVRLPLPTPLVLPAHREAAVGGMLAVHRIGQGVPRRVLRGDDVQRDPSQAADGPGEPGLHEVLGQAHRLEDLGAAVGGDRGDAHLRHDLQDALPERPVEVLDGLLGGEVADHAALHELLDALHREIRVQGARAVADQQGRVMHLPHVPGLHEQRRGGAAPRAHQVMLDGAGQQQGRDRGQHLVGVAVREHQEGGAVVDRGDRLRADLLQALFEGGGAAGDGVQPAQPDGAEVRGGGVRLHRHDLRELVVVQDREVQGELAGVLRGGLQQVPGPTDRHAQRRHDLLPQGVQRGIRDLREHLCEVVEQQPWALREHRDRGVGAHGPERFGALRGHRGQ